MATTGAAREFLRTVSDESGLDLDGARTLVEDFLVTLTGYVPEDAWQLIASVVPFETRPEPAELVKDDGSTPKDFIAEMADEEGGLGERYSAAHARAVAESIRHAMDPAQLERLADLLDDEFLALFETGGRGELTEPDGATPGAEALVGEERAREEHGPRDAIETDGDGLD